MNKHHSCGKHWLQLEFYKAALEDMTIEHRQVEAHSSVAGWSMKTELD